MLATLDRTVPDDLLVASALELQSKERAANVVLITRDINLVTKADLVGLQSVPTPSRQIPASAQPPGLLSRRAASDHAGPGPVPFWSARLLAADSTRPDAS